MPCLAVALLALVLGSQLAHAVPVCVLVAKVQTNQSPVGFSGEVTDPLPATVKLTKVSATGNLYIQLPNNGSATSPCPRNVTADTLKGAILVQPIGNASVVYTPYNISSDVVSDGTPIAQFVIQDFEHGMQGIEALPSDNSTIATELIVTKGRLYLNSSLTGLRQANMTSIARNITIGARLSVAKNIVTLALSGVLLPLNISPQATPGVENTVANVQLGGDLVATADTSNARSLVTIDSSKLTWDSLPRIEAPLVTGGAKKAEPKYWTGDGQLPAGYTPKIVTSEMLATGAAAPPPADATAASSPAGSPPAGARSSAATAISRWQQAAALAVAGLALVLH